MKSRWLVATVLFLSAISFARSKSDHSYPMDVPVGSARNITFQVQEGEFILRGDPNATSVRMNVSIDRFFIFRLGEQDILKKLIKVTGTGTDEITIATDIPRSITNWGRAEYPIDFEVVVPASVNLRVRDTSGIIEISDLAGNLDVDDDSGTVAISRINGTVNLRKASGDVRIREVKGKMLVNNKSGQMRFEKLGVLDVEYSNGNVDVTDVASANIRNESGNVRVTGVTGSLVIEDTSGEIVVRDAAGAVNITDTSGQIRTSNTGAVTVTDTDGDVTIQNSPSLRVKAKESGKVKVRGVSGAIDIPRNINVDKE